MAASKTPPPDPDFLTEKEASPPIDQQLIPIVDNPVKSEPISPKSKPPLPIRKATEESEITGND